MGAETMQQKQNRADQSAKTKEGGSAGGVLFGRIRGVNAESDTMDVTYSGANRTVRIRHPFLSSTAYHRSAPDPGVGVILINSLETKELEVLAYHTPRPRPGNSGEDTVSNNRLVDFELNKDPFRPLQPGEHDISSRGLAQIFAGRRPTLETRASLPRTWLDQDTYEAGSKAPLHTRKLHFHKRNEIGDEERFGVVDRPADGEGGKSLQDKKLVKNSTGGFAREHLMVLSNGTKNSPVPLLIDLREGNVIDNDGGSVKGKFGKDLRYLKKLFADVEGNVQIEVDVEGNAYMSFPQTATSGIKLDLPMGKVEGSVGTSNEGMKWTVAGLTEVTSQQGIKLDGVQSAKIYAQAVKLGNDGAIHPLFLTQIYKEAEKTLHTTLGGVEDGEKAAYDAVKALLSSADGINSGILAAPLIPGALGGMWNMLIFQALNALFGILAGTASAKKSAREAYKGAYDSYLSQTVKTS